MINSFYFDCIFFFLLLVPLERHIRISCRFYLLLSLALFLPVHVLLSLSPKSLCVFLFHLRIDWINMKEIEWTSISNKNYLFVYLKGIFTLILKMLFLHLHFIFYLVVISLGCVYVLDICNLIGYVWISNGCAWAWARVCLCTCPL